MVKNTAIEFLKPLAGTICILNNREEVYVFDAWDPQNRDEAENIIGWYLDDPLCETAGTKLKHLVPFAAAIQDDFEDLDIESSVLQSIEKESQYTRIYFYDRITNLTYRYESGGLMAMGAISELHLLRICSFGWNSRILVG